MLCTNAAGVAGLAAAVGGAVVVVAAAGETLDYLPLDADGQISMHN